MTDRDTAKPRCSSHDCELVEVEPHRWDCPISALSDLCDQFQALYENTYGPAPAGENGVYHRARRFARRRGGWATMSDPLDWRDMFARYAQIVGEAEGVDFLYAYQWTPAEWAAIVELMPRWRDGSRVEASEG